MNIIIVDDEAATRRDLNNILQRVVPEATITQASNAGMALQICRDQEVDVAFVDIHMPQTDGLTLTRQLKEIRPQINVIITTAYAEYALEAHRHYVSGYLLKPVMEEEVIEAMNHLRTPVRMNSYTPKLYVQCFGYFEVFYDNRPLRFGRDQAKELFAYLIHRRGETATYGECCAILWGDASDGSARQRVYFHNIWADLKRALEVINCDDILAYKRNAYAIDPRKIRCDYYEFLSNNDGGEHAPSEEYMSQYSWAERRQW